MLQKRLAACDIIFGMLRIAAHKVRYAVVVRLEKGIGRGVVGMAHVLSEVLEMAKAPFGQAHCHAANGQRLWKRIALVDRPAYPLIVEPVIDRPVVKCIAVEEDGTGNRLGGRTMVQASR